MKQFRGRYQQMALAGKSKIRKFAGRQVVTGQMAVRIPDLSPKDEFSLNVRHINPLKGRWKVSKC